MNKTMILMLLAVSIFSCKEEVETPNENSPTYSIEGKWVYENNLFNTMYIYEDGIRFTYYCTTGNCDSLYNTFEAGDTNAIPGTNNYTFVNDTLIIDLNFGNELVTPVTFECDGEKANFETPGYSLYKLGTDCQ
jgi:hypothetical protein